MKSTCTPFTSPTRFGAFLLLALCANLGAEVVRPTYEPFIESASPEAEKAISRFKFGEPFEIELFAAEPMLANPVQLYVDDQGSVFVAETYRQGDEGGVVDNRHHMLWLEDDLAAERVEDRGAMIRRHRPEMVEAWSKHHDVVRLLQDTTGDGKADRSNIFADGFNDLLDGTGAGVIARGGKVWYTNIPHLWLLEDTQEDGYADRRESLSYGYGVTVALRGHDMHGLVFGPDGKLYFSIGDRGYNVVTREGQRLTAPMEGAVFRCNLDGTDLEVFATGLRNPQGLAFDDFGNLFTGDNNSDGGDRARWVYVVEGGDSGWRMPYQSLSDRGPFMREELWKPRFAGQPAWHIPPIANLGDGPSGLAFNPGIGMPEKYNGYFFLCDFKASAAASGIWAIANEPRGAGFDLKDHHRFIWNILATDVAFGPDGSLYIADWVEGWTGVNRGRIYRLFDPALDEREEARLAIEQLQGLRDRSIPELLDLLGHPNQRMRQEAQFELAGRGGEALAELVSTTRGGANLLVRVHAIWALWQLADSYGDVALAPLLPLLDDPEPEIGAQAARVLGDKKFEDATKPLIAMLADAEPRPKYFAALGLGRIGSVEAIEPVVTMLRQNNDEDLYLRHAGVMALAGIGKMDAEPLIAFAGDDDPSVRLGVLLALRRLDHPGVALFLDDAEEFLIAEAAAAINDDTIIEEAQPNLAATIRRTDLTDERILRRAINANFRMGGLQQAQAVAAFAARPEAPVAMRVEALKALGDWHQPGSRDRVTGLWRPLTGRPKEWPIAALDGVLDELLASENPEPVRTAAIELISKYGIASRGKDLAGIVRNREEDSDLRRASLEALGEMGDFSDLAKAIEASIASESEELRRVAYGLLPKLDPGATVEVIRTLLVSETSSAEEKQTAVLALREIDLPEAEELLFFWIQKLVDDEASVAPEILLELIQAAEQSESARLQEQLRRFQESRDEEAQAVRKELLFGGDVSLGRELVLNHQAASCQRCHAVEGRGSSEVGPDLTGIGSRMDRSELLQSLVDPNARVDPAYGSYSAMPPMGSILTDEELRAIVAYLASLKESSD